MIGNHRQMKNQPDQSCLLHATCLCTMSECSVLISCSLSTKVLFALIPTDDADAYRRNAATIRVKARASWWGQCAVVQEKLENHRSWPPAWQFQHQHSSMKTLSLISPLPNHLSQNTQSWSDASFTPKENFSIFYLQALLTVSKKCNFTGLTTVLYSFPFLIADTLASDAPISLLNNFIVQFFNSIPL